MVVVFAYLDVVVSFMENIESVKNRPWICFHLEYSSGACCDFCCCGIGGDSPRRRLNGGRVG